MSAKYELQVTAQPSDVFTRCQLRTGSREIENESPVLQPCFGTVVNESLATNPRFHVQPDPCYPQESTGSGQCVPNPQTSSALPSWCGPFAMFAGWRGATNSDMQRVSSKSISVSQSPTASKNLRQLNLWKLPLPLLQKTPDVHAEHDRFQLVQGTLNVDAGCILPAIVVPVQHDFTQRRVTELGLSWFWVCRRCPCPQYVRFPPSLRGDSHWSVESTVDSLYSSSPFSFLIRPCCSP